MKWIYAPGCCSRAVPGALLWGKRVRILPKGGNLLCFPLLWCNKEHCCIWQFCKINYCSVCFFFPLFFFALRQWKSPAVGCLWGQLCWKTPPDVPPDLFLGGPGVKEKQIRDPGPRRALAPVAAPAVRVAATSTLGFGGCCPGAGLGWHQLTRIRPGGWLLLGTASHARGGGSTCHSQPWEDRINWLS